MAERGECVLENVSSVGGTDHGDGAHVAEVERLGEELAAVEDDGPLGEDVADAATDLLLGAAVGDRVSSHVEEEEVSLLGSEDALVDEALGEALSHLLELIPNLHQVPCLAYMSRKERGR